MTLVADKVENLAGNDVALEIPCVDLKTLDKLVSLAEGLRKGLFILADRVEYLHAKLLIELHQETSLIVLILQVLPQVRVKVNGKSLPHFIELLFIFLFALLLREYSV